jgi:hypothetical protein
MRDVVWLNLRVVAYSSKWLARLPAEDRGPRFESWPGNRHGWTLGWAAVLRTERGPPYVSSLTLLHKNIIRLRIWDLEMKRQQNVLKPSWKGKKLGPGKQRNCKISQFCNKRLSLSPPSTPPPPSPPSPRLYRSSLLVWGGVGGEVRIYSSLQMWSQCALFLFLCLQLSV